jgi:hypothetical protein
LPSAAIVPSVGVHRLCNIHALRALILEGTHMTNQLSRHQFLHLAAGAAALPAAARIASAQTYPSRPVRIVVGYPPAIRRT